MRWLSMLVVTLCTSCASAPVTAQERWSASDMNRTIEQTNFVVAGSCSGTLIDLELRLVLTNFHCIDHSIEVIEEEITAPSGFQQKIKRKRYKDVPVTQDRHNGYARVSTMSYVSRIVAEERKMDLALLRIQGELTQTYSSPMLPWDGVITRGERIYTVGNPAMLESSVFEGVVSNVNRTFEFPWTGGEKTPMIQFSGGIVGGNSGGALYNTRGQLIGVPSAVARNSVLGLAIPITSVKDFLKTNCYVAAGGKTVDGVANASQQIYHDPKCIADKLAKSKPKAEDSDK